MTINILIADDHGLLRAGLRSLLSREPDIYVVGEASNGDDTLDLASQLQPDVVIADISMPGPSGIEVADRLKHSQPGTKVVILTMHEDGGLLQEAMRARCARVPREARRGVGLDQCHPHRRRGWALRARQHELGACARGRLAYPRTGNAHAGDLR